MIRTILKSEQSYLTLYLPDDMIGKTIEVIAFEIEQEPSNDFIDTDTHAKAAALDKALRSSRVDLSNFKFDRDEANNYE
jgi:hypothetical protein